MKTPKADFGKGIILNVFHIKSYFGLSTHVNKETFRWVHS